MGATSCQPASQLMGGNGRRRTGGPSPRLAQAMLTPSLALAYWMWGSLMPFVQGTSGLAVTA
jgi:hypothetical protein